MLSKITTVMCYAHERGCNSLEGLSTVFCDTEGSEFFGGLCFCDPEESLRPGSNLQCSFGTSKLNFDTYFVHG